MTIWSVTYSDILRNYWKISLEDLPLARPAHSPKNTGTVVIILFNDRWGNQGTPLNFYILDRRRSILYQFAISMVRYEENKKDYYLRLIKIAPLDSLPNKTQLFEIVFAIVNF